MLKFINPYPGFYNGFHRSYEYEESKLFFGRDNDLKNLKIRFRKDKFVSILSYPKAGKTSFLKAGLIPHLEKSNFSGLQGSKWTSIYFSPGTDPILNLARAISNPQSYSANKIKPTKEEEVISKLTKNDYGLIRVSEELIANKQSNVLFIIDDFMDVFKPAVEERKQLAFKNLLVKAAKTKGTGIYVMVVFNEEDINNVYLNSHKELLKLIRQNNYKLRFLDQLSLKEAILEPAKTENSEVSDELLYRLIEELLTDQDQLRKLQIYMHRSWFEWKKNHKDKFINFQHFQKASGQRSRSKIKTRRSSDKESVDQEAASMTNTSGMVEVPEGNIALSGIIGDYNNLMDEVRSLYETLVPLLAKKNEDGIFISQPVGFNEAIEILGVKDSDLIRMANSASNSFTVDKKQLKLVDVDLMTEWDMAKAWINKEQENVEKYQKLADASIMHYIEGIAVEDIIDKAHYTELKLWFDEFKPKESWAKLHHNQYELAIDLIEKMEEIYGPVKKKSSRAKASPKSGAKKKISLKIKSKEKVEVEEEVVESEKDDVVSEVSESVTESTVDENPNMDDEDKAIAALLSGKQPAKKTAPKKPIVKAKPIAKKEPEPEIEENALEEIEEKEPEVKKTTRAKLSPRKKTESDKSDEKKPPRKKVVIKKR